VGDGDVRVEKIEMVRETEIVREMREMEISEGRSEDTEINNILAHQCPPRH
jgi:hypothetical protein